jgi:hypothetical protein
LLHCPAMVLESSPAFGRFAMFILPLPNSLSY